MSDDEQYREEEEASEEEQEQPAEQAEEPEEKEEERDEEEVKEEEKPKPKAHTAEDEGPSEAALAMQRRKEKKSGEEDEFIRELREQREQEKQKEEEEIQALKEKQARRKREREEEDKRLAELRVQEEARRRAEEDEERKKKKEEEERNKRDKRDKARLDRERMMAAIGKPNFVITKRSDTSGEGEAPKEPVAKSREQLEEEKRAILAQRIQPLNTSGFDLERLCEKARELHSLLLRLESEKYDLEERFKSQQYDMMELAERARQMSKGGKAKPGSGAARAQQQDFDALADRFTSAPPKIEMFSKYERQKDKRSYGDRKTIFLGPNWAEEVQKVTPTKKVQFFSDQGPVIEELPDAPGGEEPAAVEEEE